MKTPQYRVEASGCWIWLGSVQSNGVYGKWCHTTAHRAVFMYFGLTIPDGYEIDHLCRVTLCVNPAHLEAVTGDENRRRKYAAIVECVNGHPYNDLNTYVRPNGQRDCRTCIRDRVRRYKERRRAA